ncbi:MAG: hypothetical protein KAX44_03205 [Candidatus Brocadiae bacterium]|nr:hypothetical protein [Candidatus Brocadiia bacterium]
MADGKTLVVYYSRKGTTRRVAEEIAAELQCDIEEIVDTKDRSGARGWMGAARDARAKNLAVIEDIKHDPSSYDLVVVGTPVWAWTMSAAIRTYLAENKGRLPEVAFFLTTGGTGMRRTFRQMEELCGKPPVACLGLKARHVRKKDPTKKIKAFVGRLRG